MAIYNKITVFTTLPVNGETSVSFTTKLQVGKFTELNNMMYFNDLTGKIYMFSPVNILMVTSEAIEVMDEKSDAD